MNPFICNAVLEFFSNKPKPSLNKMLPSQFYFNLPQRFCFRASYWREVLTPNKLVVIAEIFMLLFLKARSSFLFDTYSQSIEWHLTLAHNNMGSCLNCFVTHRTLGGIANFHLFSHLPTPQIPDENFIDQTVLEIDSFFLTNLIGWVPNSRLYILPASVSFDFVLPWANCEVVVFLRLLVQKNSYKCTWFTSNKNDFPNASTNTYSWTSSSKSWISLCSFHIPLESLLNIFNYKR